MANLPYKGPVTRPCSACSAGDTAMEYHDHDYVGEEERCLAEKCIHCDPTFKPTGPDDWCYCKCHAAEEDF